MKKVASIVFLSTLSLRTFANYGDPDYTGYIILFGLVELIVLIVFFMMAANIAKIKKTVGAKSIEGYYDDYKKYLCLGENQKALISLKESIWLKLLEIKERYEAGEIRQSKYNDLKEKHEQKFTNLNDSFPQFPGDSF